MKIVYDQSVMLGYITIDKNELKVREYELYQGYYCGICKSIGRRYGQMPRLTLSYDAVFLAVVLEGLSDEEGQFKREHCVLHHIQKKPVVSCRALDYAADVMVILAYHKLLDDWKDEKKGAAFAGKTALTPAYRKLKCRYDEICRQTEQALWQLSELEARRSGSLDQTAGAFSDIMEVLFTGYEPAENQRRVLTQLGRSLGRWIYTVDALDDYAKDCEKGSYNPLIYRKNNLEGIENLLYNDLAEIAKAYDLLPMKKNQGIVENIIFMGLRAQTDRILKERISTDE